MKKYFAFFLLVAGIAGMSHAQILDMGLKLGYGSKDPQDIINNVQGEINDFSHSTEFLKKCNAGLMFRLNLGNHLYIQPEANFSLNTVWDSVEAQSGLINQFNTAISQMKSVSLNVPVLFGVKLLDMDGVLDLRIFAGPEFYTSINSLSAGGFDFQTWSAVGGVGVDLLDFVYVDGRVTYLKAVENPTAFYTLSLGLMFK